MAAWSARRRRGEGAGSESRVRLISSRGSGGPIDKAPRCGHHDHMPRHTIVGARELKTRLGGYLQRVRQGRTIVITDRGQPVAELRPLASAGTEEAVLDRLTAIGAVTRLEHRPLAPFQPIASRGRSLSLAIIEDRDDRV